MMDGGAAPPHHHGGEDDAAFDPQQQQQNAASIPTETELALLCLDHLRNLRRQIQNNKENTEGFAVDYLTMAVWALNRALPEELAENNDPFVDPSKLHNQSENIAPTSRRKGKINSKISFPSLEHMEREVFAEKNNYSIQQNAMEVLKSPTDDAYYDDDHSSNACRYYCSGGIGDYPLTLGEITAAGLTGLAARSRLQAERNLIQGPLFGQFLQAVVSKGFFEDHQSKLGSSNNNDHDEYTERYSKVVAKFRRKLAAKAPASQGDLLAVAAADYYRQHGSAETGEIPKPAKLMDLPIPEIYLPRSNNRDPPPFSHTRFLPHHPSMSLTPSHSRGNLETAESFAVVANPVDLGEAEKFKNKGNAHMQNKEFEQAIEQYTAALKLSPSGPQSHVYFSNRAAALVSLKKFEDAVADSERSLALKPHYSKAHARLGLAHFLLGNYRQAVEAYTVALKYEPDNKSSKTYLEKSAKKLAESGEQVNRDPNAASYSVVAEWDKHHVPAAVEEAEKHKNRGNSLMQSRDYTQAVTCYTKAIQLNPAGPMSHTYYSNRAAALCYLELYADAEEDSLKSLNIKPDYAKAHARLGLSRFFLKNYAGSVDAYTKSLEYDPDNAASKSYLAKAKGKLAAARGFA